MGLTMFCFRLWSKESKGKGEGELKKATRVAPSSSLLASLVLIFFSLPFLLQATPYYLYKFSTTKDYVQHKTWSENVTQI